MTQQNQNIEVQNKSAETINQNESIKYNEKLRNSGEKNGFEKAIDSVQNWGEETIKGIEKDIEKKDYMNLAMKGLLGLGGLFLAKKAVELTTYTISSIGSIFGFGKEKLGEQQKKTGFESFKWLLGIAGMGGVATILYDGFKGGFKLSEWTNAYSKGGVVGIGMKLVEKIKDGSLEIGEDGKKLLYEIPVIGIMLKGFLENGEETPKDNLENKKTNEEKIRDLKLKQQELIKKGDKEGAEKIQKEIDKISNEKNEILKGNLKFFNETRKWVEENFPDFLQSDVSIEKIWNESDGVIDFAGKLGKELGLSAISLVGGSLISGFITGGKMLFFDTPKSLASAFGSAITLNFEDAKNETIDGITTLMIGSGVLTLYKTQNITKALKGGLLSPIKIAKFPFDYNAQMRMYLKFEGFNQITNKLSKRFIENNGEKYLEYLGKKLAIMDKNPKFYGYEEVKNIENKIKDIVTTNKDLRQIINGGKLEGKSPDEFLKYFTNKGKSWYLKRNWQNKLLNSIYDTPKNLYKFGKEKFSPVKKETLTPKEKYKIKKIEIDKNLKNLNVENFLKLNPEKIPPEKISEILMEKSKNFLETEKNSEKQILDKIKEIKKFAKENKLSLEAPKIKEKLGILNQQIDKIAENKGKLFQKFNELFKKLPEDLKTPELVDSIKTFKNGTVLTRIKKGAIGRVKMMAIMGAIMVGVDTISNIDKISSGEKELSEILKNLSPEMIQMMIDILPFVGTGSMLYGAATGEETYTDNKLDTTGRVENFLFGIGGLIADTITVAGGVLTAPVGGEGAAVGIIGKIGLVIGKYGLKGEKAKFFYESLKEAVGKISKLAEKTSWSEVAGNFKKIISTKKTQAVKVANYATYGGTALAIGNGGFQYFYGNSEVIDANEIDPKLQ